MEQENILKRELDFAKVAQFGIFLAVLIALPFIKNQLITGSLVNATLFVSASLLGLGSAFLLCFVPSLVSIYAGLLPIALAPITPFIIAGNVLLVFIFTKLRHKGFWLAGISSAFVKFAFIWLASMALANFVMPGAAKSVIQMASWPQLATAIAGFAIAFLLLKLINLPAGKQEK